MKKVLLPILLLVAFGATSTFAQNVNITFELNTANISAIDAAGVFLAGGGNFGNPGDNAMTDPDGDGIYTITVSQPVGFSSHYTFTNGACSDWSCKEQLAGLPCGDAANYDDRYLPWVSADTTIKACFGSCESDGTCGVPAADVDVTFGVDLTNAPDSIKNNVAGVNIFGSINGWNADANPLTDNGNGTWSVTLPLLSTIDSFEYKFIVKRTNGLSNVEEVFDPSATCTKTTGQFTNRLGALSDNIQPGFCWNECTTCFTPVPTVGVNGVEVDENLFSINPSLVSNFANIMFSEDLTNQEKQVYVLNAVGQVVYSTTVNNSNQLRIETANYANGMYFVSVQSENVRLTKKFVVSK